MTGPGRDPHLPTSTLELLALQGRLRAVAGVLGVESADGDLLNSLVRLVLANGAPDELWLLLTALLGRFALDAECDSARRALELAPAGQEALELLDALFAAGRSVAALERELVIETELPVVVADNTARLNSMAGIQRVVRHVLPRWQQQHRFVTVRMTDDQAGFATLAPGQHARLFDWQAFSPGAFAEEAETARETLVVPWRVPIVLLEVPQEAACASIASLARVSPGRVALIGYDCIPIASPQLVSVEEHLRFTKYVQILRRASVIAGISEAASEEFRGVADWAHAQGEPGPRVISCALPDQAEFAERRTPLTPPAVPSVLSLNGVRGRKNPGTVLEACELLWREGLQFTLRFVGPGTLPPSLLEPLLAAGRPVEHLRGISDDDVRDAIESARVTVFPSLHEGYGLPVVESLSLGTPVVTSNYGSLREITRDDGALCVDPLSAPEVAAALRSLLTDDDLHAQLVERARNKPRRTWTQYADEVWKVLIGT